MDWEQYYKKLGKCHSGTKEHLSFSSLFYSFKTEVESHLCTLIFIHTSLFLKKEEKVSGVENKNSARYRSANPGPEYCSWIQQRMGYVVLPCCFRSAVDTDLSICSIPAFVSSSPNLFFPSSCSGQAASPGSQQTSNPDYSTWVDVYRQPMAFFSQGAQTQAPGLQVRSDSNVQMLKDQPVLYGMHSVLYSWSKN